MATGKQLVKGVVAHCFLLLINFCVLLGVITSLQLVVSPSITLPFLNTLLLDYMLIHTSVLLSIQVGVQASEIIKRKLPSFLIIYYFRFSDQESIPDPVLDPIRNKLGVLIILLILSGGIVLYPIFAVYGMLLLWVRLPIILLNPSTIISYFVIFLNLVPPLLFLGVGVIILSVLLIEFKRQ